ncbi:MAG: biotin synthase BioB [Proteobacteria bacterium]|nr:MAG: biotin synthase BioB [Pseudomonadota bacterium]
MLNLDQLAAGEVRYDYTRAEIQAIYDLPMTRLIFLAQSVHQKYFEPDEIQMSTLLSIKTGGCAENCAYCPQSAHYSTGVDAQGMLSVETIVAAAREAKANGSSRFCMGAAWRSPPKQGKQFNQVLEAVTAVRNLGLEVCTTLGMVDDDQATALAEAGVHAYNHNLDTSPEYYEDIIQTRVYQDRLDTLKSVRKAGMTVCCGGIVGMGEEKIDRIGLLEQLHQLSPHPESVPINLLVKVEGTPLQDEKEIDIFDMVRTIATACIIMPKSRVRLSAGRTKMSDEAQAMCFLAGASSIFTGDKLLTTPNPGDDADQRLFARLGLKPLPSKDEVKVSKEPESEVVRNPTKQSEFAYEASL